MPASEARVRPRLPMGQIGQPDEIADAVVWLLSDEARYVTCHTPCGYAIEIDKCPNYRIFAICGIRVAVRRSGKS